jgi:hypothetical protein|tara:strand:+ start:2248 stop:2736 length:489 start_codon:yes stop_codon:yes gene_type:complete
MSIKNNRPSKKSGFKQGYFNPNNPEKYIGPQPIIYRSSWEYKFCIWCDSNDKVINWSSEPVEIPYWSRQSEKSHKYYPDFYFKQVKQDGSLEEYLVEIKPKDQITKPKPPTKNSAKAIKSYKFLAEQYVKNMDKYNAAKTFSEGRGWKFIVLTEDTIKNGLH